MAKLITETPEAQETITHLEFLLRGIESMTPEEYEESVRLSSSLFTDNSLLCVIPGGNARTAEVSVDTLITLLAAFMTVIPLAAYGTSDPTSLKGVAVTVIQLILQQIVRTMPRDELLSRLKASIDAGHAAIKVREQQQDAEKREGSLVDASGLLSQLGFSESELNNLSLDLPAN